jgi:hypothetical protein
MKLSIVAVAATALLLAACSKSEQSIDEREEQFVKQVEAEGFTWDQAHAIRQIALTMAYDKLCNKIDTPQAIFTYAIPSGISGDMAVTKSLPLVKLYMAEYEPAEKKKAFCS